MRQPSPKLLLFFLVALGAGYAISFVIMTLILDTPLRLYGFGNLSLVALLIAFLLTLWLDRPFELGLFKWPLPKPKTDSKSGEMIAAQPQAGLEESLPQIQIPKGAAFPHEIPSEHWNVDFGDGKQVYQGAELPIWILAGWAIFIIWAIVYMISGLPTFHY